MKNSSTKKLIFTSLFAALTCAVSPVSIPLPGGVPLTLQQIFVMLSGLVLGARLGFLSQTVYLLLGAIGLPVFAGMTGGFDKIIGMTGGFLVGFPFLAFVSGAIYFLFGKNQSGFKKYLVLAISMIIGNIFLYSIGLSWFCKITGNTLKQSFVLCMLPFIPGDIIKMVFVAAVVPQIEKALSLSGVKEIAN